MTWKKSWWRNILPCICKYYVKKTKINLCHSTDIWDGKPQRCHALADKKSLFHSFCQFSFIHLVSKWFIFHFIFWHRKLHWDLYIFCIYISVYILYIYLYIFCIYICIYSFNCTEISIWEVILSINKRWQFQCLVKRMIRLEINHYSSAYNDRRVALDIIGVKLGVVGTLSLYGSDSR